MNYTNQQYAGMRIFLGEPRENSAEAYRLYIERFLNRLTPSRHFNTSCELVHLYLFAYFLIQ
jgi:hypothetical protein